MDLETRNKIEQIKELCEELLKKDEKYISYEEHLSEYFGRKMWKSIKEDMNEFITKMHPKSQQELLDLYMQEGFKKKNKLKANQPYLTPEEENNLKKNDNTY
ncbi:MAG: hypothetical protein LBM96_05880 [Methanobrevibacter sp.]|jgi:hypothetical protein|nr:hypothetical protein [Candidatus Methanoflexus mossambicus]